jgi:hypothetical protein
MTRTILAITLALVLATVSPSSPSAAADSDFGESGIAVLGDSLGSVLEGIRGKRHGEFMQQVLKVKVLRTDVTPLEVYSEKAFKKTGSESGATYAVVTHVACRSEVELKRYEGRKSNWYMFEDEILVAFDNHIFGWRCVVFDQFFPATIARAETERRLTAWMEKNFPRSNIHVHQLYTRGIAYARFGRVAEAEAMLSAGDEGLDVASKSAIRREGRNTLKVAGDAERASARKNLVVEIANAKRRIQEGRPHLEAPLPNSSTAPQQLTDADREALAADAERRDREIEEKFEREKDERLYVEVKGGWILVDGYRLRQGPREGETFVTYEEMVRIKAERAAEGK